MTAKYWIRIAVTMLIIFVIGAVVVHGINKGKQFVENNFPSYLALMGNGFRLDGNRLGDIQRVQFMRSAPGRVDSAVLTVKLSAAADSAEMQGCHLVASHAVPFGGSTRFSCVDSDDSTRLGLVPFGHVVVQPAGTNVALYVAGGSLDEVQAGGLRGIGTGDSGNVDVTAANGRLSVMVNGREIVSAGGGSGGGSLVIRAANGQPIVEISGDSAHGSVRIRDANGRTRVNIHDGSTTADTSH